MNVTAEQPLRAVRVGMENESPSDGLFAGAFVYLHDDGTQEEGRLDWMILGPAGEASLDGVSPFLENPVGRVSYLVLLVGSADVNITFEFEGSQPGPAQSAIVGTGVSSSLQVDFDPPVPYRATASSTHEKASPGLEALFHLFLIEASGSWTYSVEGAMSYADGTTDPFHHEGFMTHLFPAEDPIGPFYEDAASAAVGWRPCTPSGSSSLTADVTSPGLRYQPVYLAVVGDPFALVGRSHGCPTPSIISSGDLASSP
jgi:hypothetical protein